MLHPATTAHSGLVAAGEGRPRTAAGGGLGAWQGCCAETLYVCDHASSRPPVSPTRPSPLGDTPLGHRLTKLSASSYALFTADHDDRVVPAHSFKCASAIQHAQAEDGPPVLSRIDTKAAHGAGKATTKIIEESADRYAFALEVLGETE